MSRLIAVLLGLLVASTAVADGATPADGGVGRRRRVPGGAAARRASRDASAAASAPADAALADAALADAVLADAEAPAGDARADLATAPSADAGTDAAADVVVDAGVAAEDALTPVDGTYVLVDEQDLDRAERAAIESALAGLHPAMREPFRAQLHASLRAPRALGIARVGGNLSITWDQRVISSPLDGTETNGLGIEGRPVKIRHALDAGVYVQVLETRQFRRTARISVAGERIEVAVEFRSGLLPRALTTSAFYRFAP